MKNKKTRNLICSLLLAAVLVGVLLLVCVARSKKLTKPTGILMLAAYAAYFIYLLQV